MVVTEKQFNINIHDNGQRQFFSLIRGRVGLYHQEVPTAPVLVPLLFGKVPYNCTLLFLKCTLNVTYSEVIIYKGLSRILNMTILTKFMR